MGGKWIIQEMMLEQFGCHLEKHKVKYILYILQPPKTKIPDGTKCKPQKQNHESTRRKHGIKKILIVEKAFLNITQNSKAIKDKIDKLKYL